MASVDIFKQINQLFRHEEVEGGVNTFVLHRFLASDPAFAAAAKQIGNVIRDDTLATGVWQVSLPRYAKAPFFKYPAPKKPPAVEALVQKVADVENYTLLEATEVVELLLALGVNPFAHYGLDAPTS